MPRYYKSPARRAEILRQRILWTVALAEVVALGAILAFRETKARQKESTQRLVQHQWERVAEEDRQRSARREQWWASLTLEQKLKYWDDWEYTQGTTSTERYVVEAREALSGMDEPITPRHFVEQSEAY